MQCGNCGAESPNYYGYRGGNLCADCYDLLRTADAATRQEIEGRLQRKADEAAGAREVTGYQQSASLIWAGIGLLVMAIVILVGTWKEEKHGFSWWIAWIAVATGVGMLGWSIRAMMMLRQVKR